ncbi:MAG: ABC transporter ATP-binding protein [Clostridia bacterium]|jgi:multidrug/hemolysin transport system ATP-binding protein|nr:ABC transporter ATP-binding protein [Clostridia bacterium]
MNAIEIENLQKSYGEVKAVNGVSFSVEEGEFFAFLGVNGAGKSTTISILCGDSPRDGGTVKVEGAEIDADPQGIRRRLGVVFQNSALDKALTVKDNLKYRASLYGVTGRAFASKLEELTGLFQLKELLSRAVGKLSGGQRRRVDIARALVHDPRILILDEPTTGLDPQTRKTVWEIIRKLREERGLTVFLTTHYMEEAADSDHVVILDAGRVMADATPLQLKNDYTGDYITLYGVTEQQVAELALSYTRVGEAFRIEVENTEKATQLILKHAALFRDYEIVKGKMDDVFLAVTGKIIGGEV